MNGSVFVDTNVLIYARDSADSAKHARSLEWVTHLFRTRRGRLSSQVLQEYYNNVTRKLRPPMPVSDARADVRNFQAWQPISVDSAVIERAWTVEDRYRLSGWDSLIVAAAQCAGCQFLLTEDLQEGQDFGGVRVIHPFRVAPLDLD